MRAGQLLPIMWQFHASVAVAGMTAGSIASASDLICCWSSSSASRSSGVDSLMEISGGGGGIFLVSSSENSDPHTLLVVLVVFLRLPFGAGSRFGVVRLYVTVRVTTLRTLTDLLQALRGVAIVSNILLEGFDQSAGEKGEYSADVTPDMAVLGDGPVPGEKIGECCCGILSRLSDALRC